MDKIPARKLVIAFSSAWREILGLLGSAAAAWPFVVRAQRPMPVIGFLSGQSPSSYAPFAAAFRAGLRESGFVEGQNVAIEYRWAEGQYDRLPALATDLVRRPVIEIVATGASPAALAVARASAVRAASPRARRTIPDGRSNELQRTAGWHLIEQTVMRLHVPHEQFAHRMYGIYRD